jgi:predicted aconitase with swiveling domain
MDVTFLVAGPASGPTLVLDEPLSFWGGVDPASGIIVDHAHPQAGSSITGRIVVMPTGRGSSSSSSVLAECIRAGTGPAGIVLGEADPILALGALVAAELYPDRICPVAVADDYEAATTAGTIDLVPPAV